MDQAPLTIKGAAALKEELKRLKTVDRPRVIEAIADAREHGDLKENAEYHAAREQQGFIEGRIQLIEGTLGAAQIIDPAALATEGRVTFGSTVVIADEDDNQKTYQIVGELEADIDQGRISFASPIAKALLGKDEGEEIVVIAPGGEKEFEIISVSCV